jgi:hypothetical protein
MTRTFRLFVGPLLGLVSLPIYAQEKVLTNPVVSFPVVYGETPVAVRDLIPVVSSSAKRAGKPRRVVPRPTAPFQIDRAIQTEPVLTPSEAGIEVPIVKESFDGLGQGFSGPNGNFNVQYDPPDTNIGVGKSQIVEMVNTAVAVYDKGQKKWVGGPTDLADIWGSGFPDCQLDDGDPIVLYDPLADRWVLTEIGGGNYQTECVAVSQTSDATGKYYLYEFQPPAQSTDYPKLSVWPDAYYLTTNLYSNSGYLGPGLCALDRSQMLTGGNAAMICFNPGTSYDTVVSADLDGSTPPPSGSPNYMVAVDNNTHKDIAEWKFHVDFADPSRSKLTGPVLIPVTPFNSICPLTFDCVPQKGTSQKIDALGNIIMFRMAYRNFGSYESLTTVHTVGVGSGGNLRPAERWYEIRNPRGKKPRLYQQATWASPTPRFMASMAQDKLGNMLLGYSVSSTTLEPGIRYTGRRVSDPRNKMQPEAKIRTGTGYTTADRWGDYSSMVVDPSDDCTFWYANEYLTQNGLLVWHTRIASLKWPSCN